MIEFSEKVEDRIRDEYMRRIYVHMYHQAKKDPKLAAACRKPNKTLDGVIRYVRTRARGKESGGCAVVAKDEVYAWAKAYMLNDNLNYEGEDNDEVSDTDVAKAEVSNEERRHRAESSDGRMFSKAAKNNKSEKDAVVHEQNQIVELDQSKKNRKIHAEDAADSQERLLEEFYEGFGIRG